MAQKGPKMAKIPEIPEKWKKSKGPPLLFWPKFELSISGNLLTEKFSINFDPFFCRFFEKVFF